MTSKIGIMGYTSITLQLTITKMLNTDCMYTKETLSQLGKLYPKLDNEGNKLTNGKWQRTYYFDEPWELSQDVVRIKDKYSLYIPNFM